MWMTSPDNHWSAIIAASMLLIMFSSEIRKWFVSFRQKARTTKAETTTQEKSLHPIKKEYPSVIPSLFLAFLSIGTIFWVINDNSPLTGSTGGMLVAAAIGWYYAIDRLK